MQAHTAAAKLLCSTDRVDKLQGYMRGASNSGKTINMLLTALLEVRFTAMPVLPCRGSCCILDLHPQLHVAATRGGLTRPHAVSDQSTSQLIQDISKSLQLPASTNSLQALQVAPNSHMPVREGRGHQEELGTDSWFSGVRCAQSIQLQDIELECLTKP